MLLKRIIDISVSVILLTLLSPVLLIVGVLVALTSKGPILFRQVRVGKEGRTFVMYKFRSMRLNDGGPLVTVAGDNRITFIGSLLRRFKLDEVPQLWNVLVGDMSLVGPRPEVPRYVELFKSEFSKVHQVRPGITDLASIKYFDEEKLLAASVNPEETYVNKVLPDKLRINEEYVRLRSTLMDLLILAKTGARILKLSR